MGAVPPAARRLAETDGSVREPGVVEQLRALGRVVRGHGNWQPPASATTHPHACRTPERPSAVARRECQTLTNAGESADCSASICFPNQRRDGQVHGQLANCPWTWPSLL